MSRRNLILILLAGFVLALGAAGAAQRDQDRTARTDEATTAPAASGGAEAGLVEGDLPADGVIRAQVGDDVEVRVASSAPDIAKLADLGLHTSVGPGLPGTLRFRALSPGHFPVTREIAGDKVGEVVVAAAGGQDAGAAP